MTTPTDKEALHRAQAAVCRTINALAHHLPDCWRELLIAECDLEEQPGPYNPVRPKQHDAAPQRNPAPAQGAASDTAQPASKIKVGSRVRVSVRSSTYFGEEGEVTGVDNYDQPASQRRYRVNIPRGVKFFTADELELLPPEGEKA